MRNPPGMHHMRGRIAIDSARIGRAAQQSVKQNNRTMKDEMVCRSVQNYRPEFVI